MIGKEIVRLFRRPSLIFVEAIPSRSLLNKPHLLSLTQNRCILIQFVYLQMRDICFGLYLGHPQ
jgi:hypothetical protein